MVTTAYELQKNEISCGFNSYQNMLTGCETAIAK